MSPSSSAYPEPDYDAVRALLTGLPERPNTIRPYPRSNN